MKTKLVLADEFVREIQSKGVEFTRELIMSHAGEELVTWMRDYSARVIAEGKPSANFLMLMGYLIRAQEESNRTTSWGRELNLKA